MDLNYKQPFATVYGHPSAMYEQGGLLFDGAGHELSMETSAQIDEASAEKSVKFETAELFLSHILQAGAMSQNQVFHAVETNGLDWELVKTAAATLNIRRYKQGKTNMWKLVD